MDYGVSIRDLLVLQIYLSKIGTTMNYQPKLKTTMNLAVMLIVLMFISGMLVGILLMSALIIDPDDLNRQIQIEEKE